MFTKMCSMCKITKSVEEFSFRRKNAETVGSKYQAMCKGCFKEFFKKNYPRKKKQYRANNKRISDEHKRKVEEYLKSHPCMDCGESDILILTFDHRDPASKLDTIANLKSKAIKWLTIENEIAKCDVVCFNCHARRTAKYFNWKKAASANG